MNNQFTFFWTTKSPFSQWYPAKFEIKNIVFSSAEQYMMYSKALLFRDKNMAKKILSLNETNPLLIKFLANELSDKDILSNSELRSEWGIIQKEIKKYGREVNGYNEKVWARNREIIVEEGNYAKFSQNKDIKEALISTKNTYLVEASPYDKIWGIGLNESDPKALNMNTWNGLNLLGKILDKVREKLI